VALLDVLFNRLWHRVSQLSPDKQRDFAIVIGLYDFSRQSVSREFLSPLCSRMARSYANIPREGDVLFERLLDESVIAVLRSCTPPDYRFGVKLTYCSVTGLPEVLGVFALCDANHRAGRSEATVLKETRYSSDPDEARTQLMMTWMRLCGIADPRFVRDASDGHALEIWQTMTGSLIAGALRGIDRSPDTLLLSKGKQLADSTPPHRRQHVDLLIQRLASATKPVEHSPKTVADERQTTTRQPLTGPRPAPFVHPEFQSDGRAVLRVPADANLATLLQQMIVVFRRQMTPEDNQIAAEWVALIGAKPITGGRWEREHEEAFVRGFERMLWEGDLESGELGEALAGIRKDYRDLYPRIEGTALDVDVPLAMRKLYGRMLGQGS